jgi:hypothetical protein
MQPLAQGSGAARSGGRSRKNMRLSVARRCLAKTKQKQLGCIAFFFFFVCQNKQKKKKKKRFPPRNEEN